MLFVCDSFDALLSGCTALKRKYHLFFGMTWVAYFWVRWDCFRFPCTSFWLLSETEHWMRVRMIERRRQLTSARDCLASPKSSRYISWRVQFPTTASWSFCLPILFSRRFYSSRPLSSPFFHKITKFMFSERIKVLYFSISHYKQHSQIRNLQSRSWSSFSSRKNAKLALLIS